MNGFIEAINNPKFKKVYEILRSFHGELLSESDIELHLGDYFESTGMASLLRQNDLICLDNLYLEREGQSFIWQVRDRQQSKFPSVLYVTNVMRSKYGAGDMELNELIVAEIHEAECRFLEKQLETELPETSTEAIEYMLRALQDKIGPNICFEFQVVREVLDCMETALFEFVLDHKFVGSNEKV